VCVPISEFLSNLESVCVCVCMCCLCAPLSLDKEMGFFKNQILVISLLNSVGSELKDFTTWSIKLK